MNTQFIEQKFNELPNDLKQEVIDFIDFLITRKKPKLVLDHFDFNWEGSLSEFKGKFNSVDLQHQSTEKRKEKKRGQTP